MLVIRSISAMKAPGPIQTNIYHKFWSTVKEHVVEEEYYLV